MLRIAASAQPRTATGADKKARREHTRTLNRMFDAHEHAVQAARDPEVTGFTSHGVSIMSRGRVRRRLVRLPG
jgi:hypothetical protein